MLKEIKNHGFNNAGIANMQKEFNNGPYNSGINHNSKTVGRLIVEIIIQTQQRGKSGIIEFGICVSSKIPYTYNII